jgi:hypothetical protein
LACYYWKYIAGIVGVCAFGIGFTASYDLPRLLVYPGAMLIFASRVLGIVGASLCMRVPPRTGYRGLTIGLCIVECVPLVFDLLDFLLAGGSLTNYAARHANKIVLTLISVMAALSVLAGFCVLMLFLRGLARYLKCKSALQSTQATLIIGLGGFGGYVLLSGLAAVPLPVAVGIALLVFALATLAVLVWVVVKTMAIIASLRSEL